MNVDRRFFLGGLFPGLLIAAPIVEPTSIMEFEKGNKNPCIEWIRRLKKLLEERKISEHELAAQFESRAKLDDVMDAFFEAEKWNSKARINFNKGIVFRYVAKTLKLLGKNHAKEEKISRELLIKAADEKHPMAMFLSDEATIYTDVGKELLVLAAKAGSLDALAELSGKSTVPFPDWNDKGPVVHYFASSAEALKCWLINYFCCMIFAANERSLSLSLPSPGLWDDALNPDIKPYGINLTKLNDSIDFAKNEAIKICKVYTIGECYLGDDLTLINGVVNMTQTQK
jgi:hypothetical protein